MPPREAPRGGGDPRVLAWLVAALSLILPLAGVALIFAGIARVIRGYPGGWILALGGAAAIALDLAIDLWWAHPEISKSDEPDLNARARQLIGRVVVVESTIENGRGKVRVGDTLWPVEGPDCPTGTSVRVVRVNGLMLIVEPE